MQYEDGLGLTRSFPETIASLEDGNVLGSQGLFRLRAIQLEKPVILGYGSRSEEIRVQFGDIVAFLPGQPARGIEQREGFVTAEVDYLNYLLATDARMVASRQQLLRLPRFGGADRHALPGSFSLIDVQDGVASADLIARLSERLPWKIDQARWEGAERERLGKDMFVSLALENMRVYMVGSLLLAFASVLAIALANFLADKRTFGLLRLRGLAPSLLLRISLSFFLLPVMAGVLLVGIVRRDSLRLRSGTGHLGPAARPRDWRLSGQPPDHLAGSGGDHRGFKRHLRRRWPGGLVPGYSGGRRGESIREG